MLNVFKAKLKLEIKIMKKLILIMAVLFASCGNVNADTRTIEIIDKLRNRFKKYCEFIGIENEEQKRNSKLKYIKQ